MRTLVIGNGGREHAICWKLSQCRSVEQIFTAPGNPGTALVPRNENVQIRADAIPTLVAFASTEGIDLTVVGPEQPLSLGIVDRFLERGLRIFGPTQAAARLESSKLFAKEVMSEAGVPTAAYNRFAEARTSVPFLESARYPLVVKSDGLAAGKGVAICERKEDAITFVESMKGPVLIEEFLEGEEASFFVISDGSTYVPFGSAQDHKRLLDGDRGPNTGGMGAYSPAPVFTSAIQEETETKIVRPILQTMAKRECPFAGVLYVGLMLTKEGPKVLEFNTRFGDPEAQVLLPRLDGDLAELFMRAARGRLADFKPVWKNQHALTVVLASEGYPNMPKVGRLIDGIPSVTESIMVFQGGTASAGKSIQTSGGRVCAVTALGTTLKEATALAYGTVDRIQFMGKQFRKDIGWRALAR